MTAPEQITAWGDYTSLGINYKAGPRPMENMVEFPATQYTRTDLIPTMIRETEGDEMFVFVVLFTNFHSDDELAGLYSTEKLAQAKIEKYNILDRRSMRIEKELLDQ